MESALFGDLLVPDQLNEGRDRGRVPEPDGGVEGCCRGIDVLFDQSASCVE
jgi:hypothetical protein